MEEDNKSTDMSQKHLVPHRRKEDKITDEERLIQLEKDNAVLSSLVGRNLAVQEKLSDSMESLSNTLTEVRLTMNSMQAEIKNHSVIIENMSKAIDIIKTDTIQISELQTKMITTEKETREKFQLVHSRIDDANIKIDNASTTLTDIDKKVKNIDDKGKIDIITMARSGIVWIFAGGGLFAILQIIFNGIELWLKAHGS